MKIVPDQRLDVNVITPGFRSMSRDAFRARVVELLPYSTVTQVEVPEALLDKMIDAAIEFEMGPYDTACEIIDKASPQYDDTFEPTKPYTPDSRY